MSEQLAVIKGVKFGVNDRDLVALSFGAYIEEHAAALQVLGIEDAVNLIKAFGVSDVRYLDGKTVWVECGDSLIKYLRPAVLGGER